VSVEVRLPTILRAATGGAATVEAEGATVGEVFDDLVRRFPDLKGRVITEDGTLHKFVNVYLNDDDVRYLDKLDTKVADGNEISILPAVAGGAGLGGSAGGAR
jgi:molybdopterin synthase sulfur carrier subunit